MNVFKRAKKSLDFVQNWSPGFNLSGLCSVLSMMNFPASGAKMLHIVPVGWCVVLTVKGPTWALIPSVCVSGNSVEQRSDQAFVWKLVPQHQILQCPEAVYLHALRSLFDTQTEGYMYCINHMNKHAR